MEQPIKRMKKKTRECLSFFVSESLCLSFSPSVKILDVNVLERTLGLRSLDLGKVEVPI